MNRVRLYSNGTAVISRDYPFDGPEPLRVSIPVRKADLDDVVSSLAVFGDVAVVQPPTYSPTNAEEPALKLDPSSALRSLVTKMAGATVEVEAGSVYRGKLLGLQPYRREYERTYPEQHRLIILTEKGVQQVEEPSIVSLRFVEPEVRAEVDKALRATLGNLKPDGRQVEMTLRPHPGATGATVTYATPVAAWKLRYQLRASTDGFAELEGQAVVDNDTDDDWVDALVTVVTGEPITFSTDLAETRRPARGRVNVVADRAAGAVSAGPELADRQAEIEQLAAFSRIRRGGGYGGGPPVGAGSPSPPDPPSKRADQQQAEGRESGDFSLFTSAEPVSVGAGRSAIIPLFRLAVGEAKSVLLYKEEDDPARPFRAVRFRNPGPHSLGRGVCEVFIDGDFQGKCLIDGAKPGEESLVVHARETGVRVTKKSLTPKERRLSIRIAEGVVYREILRRRITSYRIRNAHPEAFDLEIEHPRELADSRVEASTPGGEVAGVDIPGGRRFRLPLPPAGDAELKVHEERVEGQELAIKQAWPWLADDLIALEVPTGGVRRCVEAKKHLDAVDAEVHRLEAEASTIAEEQERLMKLIGKAHADQATAWRTDLADAEKELRRIKRTALPERREERKAAEAKLLEAFASLRYAWGDPTKTPTARPRADADED